jgi:hypothetical protein
MGSGHEDFLSSYVCDNYHGYPCQLWSSDKGDSQVSQGKRTDVLTEIAS